MRAGWSAVSSEPMTWEQYQIALQHLSEERVGKLIREAERAEDAEFERSKQGIVRG